VSDFMNRIAKLSPKQLMVLADELNSRIEKLGRAASQPIAVIGAGCRFPGGADSPERFWELLAEGRDGIREVPPERWEVDRYYDPDPERPGKMNTRWGGFLAGIEHFDAEFFGISPREAVSMDPQQRLALEVAWETIENAGISPPELAGSRTGVYLGICNADYSKLLLEQAAEAIDAYLATGSAHSIAAGRISYLLDLEGPSLAVDTACSSSLVAVHLACQSLRAGECRLALAGGVNLILLPETTLALSRARMLSPHGRCKAFDQSADGFVRAEGCGMLALKRLADARDDGDAVLGLILGSAVNQDGRSGGITAPNGPSQTDVIRHALRDAGLEPSAVEYIEAHGTGTILGDPIEMRALGEVFGPGRDPRRPLLVGSVKTNIGHAESAAGIAGLIKALLAVQHGEIPPHLHFATPNAAIDWQHLPVRIPTARTPWHSGDRPRVAGVSSFGFSGTNAHVLIGQAPQPARTASVSAEGPRLFALSGRDGQALAEWAGRYAGHIGKYPGITPAALSRTINAGRSHFAERAAFVADSTTEAQAGLERIARRAGSEDILRSPQPVKRPPQVVFMFTGQGSQYPHMGRALYHSQAVFRRTLDQCAELLRPIMDRPLLDLLYASQEGEAPLARTDYAQPALFALEYALAALWKSWGIEPAAVLGHSVGEYVAACVAEIFSLEEGLRLIARRGQLMQALAAPGAMAALAAPAAAAQALIDEIGPGVCIAALNGPRQTVLSGEPAALRRLLEQPAAKRIGHRPLHVARAFHSHLMEPVLPALAAEAGRIAFREPQIPIVSNLTGAFAHPRQMESADYWREHSRRPVRFAESLETLHAAGYRHFLEIGPHPVLSMLGQGCLADPQVIWHHAMARGKDDHREILRCLGSLYVNGAAVQWRQVGEPAGPRLHLPTYPFQRRAYWLERSAARAAVPDPGRPEPGGHPLLGRELFSPEMNSRVFEAWLGCDRPAFLRQHRIFGQWIMPTPAYLEMAMAAAESAGMHDPSENGGWVLADVQISEALKLPEGEPVRVQTLISNGAASEGLTCRFFSGAPSPNGVEWRRKAQCRILKPAAGEALPARLDLATIQSRCPVKIAAQHYYRGVQGLGLDFGAAFQGLQAIWKGAGEALGEMILPGQLEPESAHYRIHPALLDACFHLLGAALPEEMPGQAFLLIGIGRVRLYRKPPGRFWNLTRLHAAGGVQRESIGGDITLFDQDGAVIAQCDNLLLRRTRAEALEAAVRPREADVLYRLAWVPRALPLLTRADWAARLIRPADLAPRLSADLKRYGDQNGLWVYAELLPQLDRWCLAAIVRMLRTGAETGLAGNFTPGDLAGALRALPRYTRLLNRLCATLEEEGFLVREGPGLRIGCEPLETDAAVSPEALLKRFPSCAAEIEMTVRCAEHLHEVLSGACDPLELLFPRAEVQTAEHIYERSPYARSYNAVIADALAAETAARHAAGANVRVLEIGGGTGGTTAHVLGRLDPHQDHYTFSDISPLFVARAGQKFRAYAGVDFRVLDIESDPEEQGFAAQAFDIVIAANVLHATKNLKETLLRIRRLLAPGGLVLLLEGTAPQRWVDLTFGLTDGWWRFEDTELRPDYPLIDRARWLRLLTGCGFDCATAAVEDPALPPDIFNQTVIVARKPVAQTDLPKAEGTWLLFADSRGLDAALAGKLADAGANVLRAGLPAGGADRLKGCIEEVRTRLHSAAAPELKGVVYFANPDAGQAREHEWVPAGLTELLGLMQALAAVPPAAKLWVCTRGAQAVAAPEPAPEPRQAALWGLSRVFSLEHPQHFGGIVDLPSGNQSDATAAWLYAHIVSAGDEDQAALRDGLRFVPRIVNGAAEAIPERPVRLRRDAAYLITGGLGGLGLKIAGYMAGQGAGRLILASRRRLPARSAWESLPQGGETAAVIRAIRAIEASGAQVDPVSVDVGDREAMGALFEGLQRDADRPLKGILHAAVQMSGAPIERLDPAGLAQMFRAKVGGAMLLDELSRNLPLDFFVLFSSTTALWGAAGLGHYAAANQYLDLLAQRRRTTGRAALSINWGTWEEMRAASAEDRQKFSQAGLNPMPAGQALALLGRLMGANVAQICAAAVDWARLRALYEARRPRPIFSLVAAQPAPERPAAPNSDGLCERLAALPAARRQAALVAHLQTRVREVLRLAPDMAVDSEKGFFDMGMDSLMAVELKSRIEKDVAMALPATLTFNYPTIEDIAGFLLKQMPAAQERAPLAAAAEALPAPVPAPEDELTEEELSDLLAAKLKELS